MKKLIILIYFINILIGQNINENFDDVSTLTTSGWIFENNSSPLGTQTWRQDFGNFTAFNGSANSSIICDYLSVPSGSVGDISNWLITPTLSLNNGDTIRFYTNSYQGQNFPDRLEVRLNLLNTIDCGTDFNDVGDFDSLLLSINPNLLTNVYPSNWTQFTIPISGLASTTNGRIGFRYFVEEGGQLGVNGSTVGIDHFTYKNVFTNIEEETSLIAFTSIVNNYLFIEIPYVDSNYEVIISDLNGKTIFQNIYETNAQIEITNYLKSIYILKIIYKNKFLIKKIYL